MYNLPDHIAHIAHAATHRTDLVARIAYRLFVGAAQRRTANRLAQPSMAWFDGPRTQPRDARGRFLSRAWLADAELFLPTDRAWFRHPVTAEGK